MPLHLLGGKTDFSFQGFQYKRVGFVDDGGVEAGKIDLGSCFAVVAHAFGNYRERNAFGFRGGGPAVAGDVEGQRDGDADHRGYSFQVVVDVVAGVAGDASFVDSLVADYRKQVVAFVFGIFVEYHLHLLRPLDNELLPGLAASVSDVAVFEFSLFEKGHIYEAHPSEIKTHQEHITGVVECWSQRQFQSLDFLDDRQRQCAFHGLVNAGVDVAERIAVLDDVVWKRRA